MKLCFDLSLTRYEDLQVDEEGCDNRRSARWRLEDCTLPNNGDMGVIFLIGKANDLAESGVVFAVDGARADVGVIGVIEIIEPVVSALEDIDTPELVGDGDEVVLC